MKLWGVRLVFIGKNILQFQFPHLWLVCSYFPFCCSYFLFLPGLILLFSCPVMSNSLWPHGLQHTRPLCPSPSPKVCPSSCPLHLSIPSHLLTPTFSSAFNLSQHQGLFQQVSSSHQMTQILELQLQHPASIQGWFPLRLPGLICLLSKGLSGVFSRTIVK